MAKTLLQEAIAEAKQLREAAIQNATKQLEENLTPSIKEMLAKKLEEELDFDESNEEETTLDENSNSGFKEVKLKEAEDGTEKDDKAEDTVGDTDTADDGADASNTDDAEAPTEDEESADASETDAAAGETEQSDDTPLKDVTLGDLKTLIQDIVAASSAPAPEGDLGADMDAGGVEGMGDETAAGDIAATDATAAAEDAAVAADDANAAAADANAAAEDDDEEIDISEIIKELENEDKCPDCGKDKENCICKENKANDVQPENQNGKEHHKEPNENGPSQDSELNELKAQLEEKEEKIKKLEEGLQKVTKTLNDVNLLNGKLVYTTRLLNRQNLSEAQKANVIKTLDGAKTTTEVKSLYRTLLEGLKNDKKNVVTESRRGSASRPAGGSTASTILEGDEMVRRFQQLAGIINE